MTRQTFFRKLRKFSSKFNKKRTLKSCVRLNKDGKSFCPITAVLFCETGVYRREFEYTIAGRELGLTYEDITDIVYVADRSEKEVDSQYLSTRRALERAASNG